MDSIIISGARQHNLKNIDVTIPRDSLTVITGLSGSGKSSLAFDTLYAEGQRRYVESLSAYARQFLDQIQKPEVDQIQGLSPAIAIEQRTTGGNPRSIVATVTEIHDYLRLLYGTIGKAFCPECGRPVAAQSAEQISEHFLSLPNGTKLILMAPLVRGRKGRHEEVFEAVRRQGFTRVRVDGTFYALDDVPELDKKTNHSVEAVIDRLVAGKEIRTRLTDSVELALKQGSGVLFALEGEKETIYSEKNACAHCKISFEELKPRSFSFNSPYGACPACGGLGVQLVCDEDLAIPDKSLPLREAIKAWRTIGHHAIMYYKAMLEHIGKQFKINLDTPFEDLSPAHKKLMLYGSKENLVLPWRNEDKPFEGILENIRRRYEEAESDEMKEKFSKFLSRQKCPVCNGARLRPESRICTVGGKTIVEVMSLAVRDATGFFETLKLTSAEEPMVTEVLKEIRRRLKFLVDVGLEYLSLDRESSTLSGGEMQRIRLATQIGSGLMGVMYVLDEPTIGLHARDNERLIKMLRMLQERGNTVIIVEHDEEMIRHADYIIDLGPGAGVHGGEVVYQGNLKGLMKAPRSETAAYLSGRKKVEVPKHRVKPSGKWLKITGAEENNLRNVDAEIPIGCFVCVTGVSGSGKSTLIDDVLYRHLAAKLNGAKEKPGRFKKITGDEHFDKMIEIDQSPIGRTPRSNCVTYTGCFSTIRELFASVPAAKARGYTPGRFSFNVKGGRCEVCQGDGVRCLEMHFLPDVYVTCEQCGGQRYNKETLEVRYGGKTISEVLEMTVSEGLEFFKAVPAIANKLRTLEEVGLGYIKLGQPATTLSGGEAQRIKLATELSKRATGKTLYLLDEPTTGLHFVDVHKLLDLLLRLRESGNTVVVIEHNLDIIKSADWILDLGPGGGDQGGRILVSGPPEKVATCAESYTGHYLKPLLGI